ncbi:tryptophan synthase subunit alpha [Shewanella frigidimarina]|uniref:Tryptophan synthase alpha chain n=1 Tax=Shewanella frigidimarina TaxID=56812 RepID=H1AFK5_SHEFR|nr:Chain A, Tryptophan synthase alpha chain [Shewanella frigidimarina]3VND_B Chain B, Tryptophan synthase alpha chain [Shewanella frigidimarina]3VND_C Chain C, Tryptophan synthase alpha chain [Shewanella frigidimarina]3VND_D Chain D, Tryptophan synthase alpha chain [Shewanella frigidimarina]3VND_E Chain E, Tryptophan synthase alpha chain [Shewanella frigidimarina]3VND_F Chain F, Tryptophan synthase alpha chain [Shewanella frigidimarina]3VND_G Chain G, Tryptophan synthase alpha chain [Shewanel
MSNRYQAKFAALKAQDKGAFVPFVTIGDPSPELSLKIIQTLVDNGADALELGFPFSDPLADGPVIQGANLRSLAAGTTSSDCFDIITKVRAQHPDMPIGLLLYANLVFANGIDEFYTKAQAAGVDSVLIADVPVEESAPFSKAAKAHGIAPIFIAPPNADADTLKMVSEQGEGYTYLLSRAGVTGTESKAGEPIENILTQLAEFNAPPPLLGFGIAEPEQVRAAIKAGAAGAISGSAVVKIIEAHQHDEATLLAKLAEFTTAMKAAT